MSQFRKFTSAFCCTRSQKIWKTHFETQHCNSMTRLSSKASFLLSTFGLFIWSQNVTQAYLGSFWILLYNININPIKEFKHSHDQFFMVLESLRVYRTDAIIGIQRLPHIKRTPLTCHKKFSNVHWIESNRWSGGSNYWQIHGGDSQGRWKKTEEDSKPKSEKFDLNSRDYNEFKLPGMEISALRENFGFQISEASFAEQISALPLHLSFPMSWSDRQEVSWFLHNLPDLAGTEILASEVT